MQSFSFPVQVMLLCAACVGSAFAENADKNKPMNIESDSLRVDNQRQVSVFTGRVLMTKGTIQIRGAQVEIRQDAGGDYGVITGSPEHPAFFRQKREGLDEFIEGEGETIEYDGKADTVKFIKKAQFRRLRGSTLGDEIVGATIQYNSSTDLYTVDGGTPQPGSSTSGRVRVMLSPRPAATPAPAANPSPTPNLRPSSSLPEARK